MTQKYASVGPSDVIVPWSCVQFHVIFSLLQDLFLSLGRFEDRNFSRICCVQFRDSYNFFRSFMDPFSWSSTFWGKTYSGK